VEVRGGGFIRSNPDILSMTVQAAWSMTILLCERKGRPEITGAQRDRAIIAHTVFEVHKLEVS
jgi:hypothetical protein